MPRPCDQSCCSNPFDGAPRALASGRRSVEMLQSPTSLGDHRSVMTASTPSAMVTSCETMVMSPPKLELGDVPPSEEALEVECATLVRISEDDNDINVTVEPGGGSTVDAAQSVDEEDFNFDFLHDDQEPDMEWSDGSDDEDLERNARSHVGCGCAPKSDADAADAILLGDGRFFGGVLRRLGGADPIGRGKGDGFAVLSQRCVCLGPPPRPSSHRSTLSTVSRRAATDLWSRTRSVGHRARCRHKCVCAAQQKPWHMLHAWVTQSCSKLRRMEGALGGWCALSKWRSCTSTWLHMRNSPVCKASPKRIKNTGAPLTKSKHAPWSRRRPSS